MAASSATSAAAMYPLSPPTSDAIEAGDHERAHQEHGHEADRHEQVEWHASQCCADTINETSTERREVSGRVSWAAEAVTTTPDGDDRLWL